MRANLIIKRCYLMDKSALQFKVLGFFINGLQLKTRFIKINMFVGNINTYSPFFLQSFENFKIG